MVGPGDVISRVLDSQKSCTAGVVQRYQHKPYLIAGLKFDLRCYMACVSGPGSSVPTCYLFRDGLARFATEPYEQSAATAEALPHAQHLTNYSVNQTESNSVWGQIAGWFGRGESKAVFVESIDAAGTGGLDSDGSILCHKWSAAETLNFMHAQEAPLVPGPSICTISTMLGGIVSNVLLSHAARSKRQHRSALDPDSTEAQCRQFELVGVDVLFDSSGKPHLIELQRRPNLIVTSELDLRVKSQLVAGMDELLAWHETDHTLSKDLNVNNLQAWAPVELDERCRMGFETPNDHAALADWHCVDEAICKSMQDDLDNWEAIEMERKASSWMHD